MVKGFQSWNSSGSVSVVRLTEQNDEDFAGLTGIRCMVFHREAGVL